MFKINNKTPFSSGFIIYFEEVNVSWAYQATPNVKNLFMLCCADLS